MSHTYLFGAVEVRGDQREVRVDGLLAPLGSRAFDVLLALIHCRDRVVSRSELLESAWPALEVEDNNISVQVCALRKWLGATAITTIPGRGYQFTMRGGEVPDVCSA